jgi:hypothetical protein
MAPLPLKIKRRESSQFMATLELTGRGDAKKRAGQNDAMIIGLRVTGARGTPGLTPAQAG